MFGPEPNVPSRSGSTPSLKPRDPAWGEQQRQRSGQDACLPARRRNHWRDVPIRQPLCYLSWPEGPARLTRELTFQFPVCPFGQCVRHGGRAIADAMRARPRTCRAEPPHRRSSLRKQNALQLQSFLASLLSPCQLERGRHIYPSRQHGGKSFVAMICITRVVRLKRGKTQLIKQTGNLGRRKVTVRGFVQPSERDHTA